MEKSRKSKKALIIVAIALMAALVVGMGAMTYSKYITTGASSATATAAKWGFVVTANAQDLFGSDYTKNGATATKVASGGVAVSASESGLTLAPGTSGSMNITVNGTAEVLAQLTFAISQTSLIGIDYTEGEDYYPIKWTLKKNGVAVDGASNASFADLASEVANQSSKIAIGGSLSDTYTIEWVWALDDNNDAKDTLIGMQAHYESLEDGDDKTNYETILNGVKGEATVESTLSFTLSVTVKQIQE